MLGLHALQHRGQEAAGIVTFDGRLFHTHRAMGLVGDNFSSEEVIARPARPRRHRPRPLLDTGAPLLRNVQPLFADFAFGGLALAHNGNLTNALTLRRQLVEQGCMFQSTSDTEVIIHLIARSREAERGRAPHRRAARRSRAPTRWSRCPAASSIGVRDPLGVRPLVLGELDGAPILASETCALDIIGASFVRDIEPGEMVIVDRERHRELRPFAAPARRFCIFEYVYFARPDSAVEGRSVYEVRKRIGAELRARAPGARRHRGAGAGLRRAGRDRLRRRHRACRSSSA